MSDQGGNNMPCAAKVREPLVVADAEAVEWNESCDIVVVGFGGAGAASAMQAREAGASVRVLERFEGAGATMLSGGIARPSHGNNGYPRDCCRDAQLP